MTARAVLIAQTMLIRQRFDKTPYTERPFPSAVETVLACDELSEFAGRSIHGTWTRGLDFPTNRDYLRTMLSYGEVSAFDHSTVTFWLTGVSVEFVRLLTGFPALVVTSASFDYADPQKVGLALPSALVDRDELTADVSDHFEDAMMIYEDIIRSLMRDGFSRRQATDSASYILPGCAETTVVLTGSLAAFRIALDAWQLPSAGQESREVATALLRELVNVAPNTFQDFGEDGKSLRIVENEYGGQCPDDCELCESLSQIGTAAYGSQSIGALRVA